MRDQDFIAGRFFETEIPKDKQYLLKYFSTPQALAFLRYYLVFRDTSSFTAHTGVPATKKWLVRHEALLHKLTQAYKEAKAAFDFDLLWQIESGKYK